MSLHDQRLRLGEQGAAMNLGIFQSTAVMQEHAEDSDAPTFVCHFTLAAAEQELAGIGIRTDVNLILRVPKTEPNFSGVIGKNVIIYAAAPDGGNLAVRLVVKKPFHPLDPMHVFGCKSLW